MGKHHCSAYPKETATFETETIAIIHIYVVDPSQIGHLEA